MPRHDIIRKDPQKTLVNDFVEMSMLANIQPAKKNVEVDAKQGTNNLLLLEHCKDRVSFTELREENVPHGLFF